MNFCLTTFYDNVKMHIGILYINLFIRCREIIEWHETAVSGLSGRYLRGITAGCTACSPSVYDGGDKRSGLGRQERAQTILKWHLPNSQPSKNHTANHLILFLDEILFLKNTVSLMRVDVNI